MTFDKIILIITMLLLAGVGCAAQLKQQKRAQEKNYSVEKVRVTNIDINLDIKNGTTYGVSYKRSDGTEIFVETTRRPWGKKQKIYIEHVTNDDGTTETKAIPYKNYWALVGGSLVIVFAQIYVNLI